MSEVFNVDVDIEKKVRELLECANKQNKGMSFMFYQPQISEKSQKKLEGWLKDLGWNCLVAEDRQLVTFTKRKKSRWDWLRKRMHLKDEN